MPFNPWLIALFLMAFSGCMAQQPTEKADSAKGNVEFRLAEIEPGEGLVRTNAPGWSGPIYLHKEVEMTGADIRKAALGLTKDGKYDVMICFTKGGAEKMSRLSETHLGKVFAIIIDGEIVIASPIREKVTECVGFAGGLTEADAHRIVRRLGGE